MECIKLNGLYKLVKKVRSSQAAIVVLNQVKQGFYPLSIVKRIAVTHLKPSQTYFKY